MIYVSIDIETTGLDHEKNQVLSIGAIIEDTDKKLPYEDCPKFNAIILQRELTGSPRAIDMNQEIIHYLSEYLEGNEDFKKMAETATGYSFYEKDEVVAEFYRFLYANGYQYEVASGAKNIEIIGGKIFPLISGNTKPITLNVAGKNFGTFDKLFLQELPWWQKLIRTRQRILDPAILCVDWKNDTSLPSLIECKDRKGVEGIVTHNALEDAWDVICILRKFY